MCLCSLIAHCCKMSLHLVNALFPPEEPPYRKAAVEFFRPDLYNTSVVKGRRLYDIMTSLDAPVKTSSPTQLVAWYDVERGAKPLNVKAGLQREFKEWNVSNLDFEFVTVSSSLTDDPAYNNWYNARQKCILNYSNYKRLDRNSANQRLFPSEVVWQSWLLVGQCFPNFEPSSLRMIARCCVINLSARRAIWYAARRSTCLYADRSSGWAVYTKDDEGFYAILGSDNGASSMRLLIDHKYELGGRIVERIVVVGGPPSRATGKDLYDDFTRARAFILVLSERTVEITA
jgi:hypothetical protein